MAIAEMSCIPDILTRLEEEAENAGWDQPAALYGLHSEHVTDDMMAIGVAEFPGFGLGMALTGHCFHAIKAMPPSPAQTTPTPTPTTPTGSTTSPGTWSGRPSGTASSSAETVPLGRYGSVTMGHRGAMTWSARAS